MGAIGQLVEKLCRLCTGEFYVADDESANTVNPVVDTILAISHHRAEVEFRFQCRLYRSPLETNRFDNLLDDVLLSDVEIPFLVCKVKGIA